MQANRNATANVPASSLALALAALAVQGAAPLPEPILAGLVADTAIEEEEGDRYILAYPSRETTKGKPDARMAFELRRWGGTGRRVSSGRC